MQTPLKIVDAVLIENQNFADARGQFQTVWEQGPTPNLPSAFRLFGAYHSHNRARGTLRGMHYQRPPHTQAKIVSCPQGVIFDVILDLRPESGTYLQWEATRLSASAGNSLYVPHGCAHGFMTLESHTIVSYLIEGAYEPGAQATVRWNDPAFAIQWPAESPTLSERDRDAPLFAA